MAHAKKRVGCVGALFLLPATDVMRGLIAGLLMALFATTALADQRLELLKHISTAGAPALTLKMLDQAQPPIDQDLYAWIAWEQERLAILAQWGQWNDLLVRIETLPVDVPGQFRRQAATYKARAYLNLDQAASAREVLRAQLWQSDAGDAAEYENWRQLVIETYLHDGRHEDARVAMLRFDQDFDNRESDWLLLRARVLIETGRYDQALALLADESSWQADLTRLLARLRAGDVDAGEVWRQVKTHAAAEDVEPERRASLWALGFHAAATMSPVDRVVALEALFKSGAESPLKLFRIPVDRLWQAYLEYAELVGNRSELLLGDDAAWLDLAARSGKATPIKARSLYAMLLLRSGDGETADRAAAGYMQTLGEIDAQERSLLDNLFNRSRTFSSARKIPPSIRYQLVDLALQAADIDEATRLMSGLETVPDGASRFDWQLRQSRVLILGGRYREGDAVLRNLIGEYREPQAAATDRLLQVLFDLQTVGLHEEAIAHFNALLRLEIEPKQRREILFWIADSFRGLEQHDQAALLYLQSAMLPGPETMDPWGQTARYNAAESLQAAGLIDDARRIFVGLLRVTEDPARRAVLNHRIQQLWLNQGAR